MAFKIKPILTPRQLRRSKYTLLLASTILASLGILSHFVGAAEEEPKIKWNGQEWETMAVDSFPRGRIVYFSKNSEVCSSTLLLPGIAIMSSSFLAVCYGLFLCYLFLGISIVADIFMGAIEEITSQKVLVPIEDKEGNKYNVKIARWNKTVANLTLMALGSSAPEILLAVLETSQNLGKCPGELGASTIVGSAAFNLLVISGICVWAISKENDTDPDRDQTTDDGIKKIYNMKVFAITATSSLFAYVWLWYVLLDQMVALWEGIATLLFFFILVIFAYCADKINEVENTKEGVLLDQEAIPTIKYSAWEIYQDLLKEKNGTAKMDTASVQRREEMKKYVKDVFNTDKIENINLEELKEKCDGPSLLPKAKHKAQFHKHLTGQKSLMKIEKHEKFILQHARAKFIDESLKNENFGFSCLHYSVAEGIGKIEIEILNKRRQTADVLVKTYDGDAVGGDDYVPFNEVISFRGEKSRTIMIQIMNDDEPEPDEDFFVQLYDPNLRNEYGEPQELSGEDTKTKVTIIDDDKPGKICFDDPDNRLKASFDEEYVDIVVSRKEGSDGLITVEWQTVQEDKYGWATEGVHYVGDRGKLEFKQSEIEKTVRIKILKPAEQDKDSELLFGFKLFNIYSPSGMAKLTNKSTLYVTIVADMEKKKQEEAITQLLQRLEEEEAQTWGSQFIKACMLHPTKGDDGEIIDIEYMDAILHFLTIGWKLLFAIIPPAHYGGGVPCFVIALTMIGIVTYVVGEVANLFGCVLGIPPGITAITFVALGTSLPDTFASKNAAESEKYADDAVGNVTGSNSVNVFLGLGLPWVIANIYEYSNGTPQGKYYVPAGSLGFSVVVFIITALLCLATLLIRRKMLGGELGGTSAGRWGTFLFFVALWVIYIVASVLQAYNVGGKEFWAGLTFGIQSGVACPYPA